MAAPHIREAQALEIHRNVNSIAMQENINYRYMIKSRQNKTCVKYKKVSTDVWLI